MTSPRFKWPVAYQLAITDDGRLLACLGRTVVVIDTKTSQRVSSTGDLPHPSHAAFSPDGKLLAVKATNGRIVVIDPYTGTVLHDHRNQEDGEGSGLRFSLDGRHLVDGSWGGVLTIRDARRGDIVSREHHPGEMIRRITQDRSRRTWLVEHALKVRTGDGAVPQTYFSLRRWPMSPATTQALHCGMEIEAATLSPDGGRLCFIQSGNGRRLHVAEASKGRVLTSSAPLEVSGTGSELAWSRDGRYIVTTALRAFLIHRAADLAIVAQLPCRYPSSAASIDDRKMAIGSWNTTSVVDFGDIMREQQPA